MSLSNLTSLTQAQYRALIITPFPFPPNRSSSGNPDTRVSVQLGGWVGTDVLAFIVNNAANADSSLSIENATTQILKVEVAPGSNPNTLDTYWTVNMGAGASGTDWQITYNVADGNVDTGRWVFVKGKSDDDKLKYQ